MARKGSSHKYSNSAHIHLIYGSDKRRRQILLFCKKVLAKQTNRDKNTYRCYEYTLPERVSCWCPSIQRSICVYAFDVWHSVPTFPPVHPVAFPPAFQHKHPFISFKHCAFLQVWPAWDFFHLFRAVPFFMCDNAWTDSALLHYCLAFQCVCANVRVSLNSGGWEMWVKCWVLVHVRFRSAAPVASSGHLCISVSPSKRLSCSPVISSHRLSSLTNC